MNYFKNIDKKVNFKKVGYSVDKDIAAEFDEYCRDNAINKSKWIEVQMRRFLEQAKKN